MSPQLAVEDLLGCDGAHVIFSRPPRSHVLIAVGLLGMSLYAVATRFPQPAVLADDFVQGTWYGLCLGLEILGLCLLRRTGPSRPA